jgi:hypothetical protein
MRYPYDLFIKFLISRKADVNGTLANLDLPELSTKELSDRNFLAGPLPPSVRGYLKSKINSIKNKKAFIEWAEAHDIREMWEIQPEYKHDDLRQLTQRSGAMKKACDLFATANQRTALSLMLMRDFEDEDIIDTFLEHFDVTISNDVLDLSRKFFFDFREMKPTDWHNLFHNLAPEERDKLATAHQGVSKEFIEYSIGKFPKITYEEILHDIMVTSFFKFKALSDQPLMDQLAQRWATMAMAAGEKKIKYTKGDRTDLGEDIQLRFEFEQPTFPTMAELSTGKHNSQE